MTATDHLALPFMDAAQSQKTVTHNMDLIMLDCLVQLSVLARNQQGAPTNPKAGDRYLVGANPTGVFANHAGQIAAYQNAVWNFYAPQPGWLVFVLAEQVGIVFTGSGWVNLGEFSGSIDNVAKLGVGTAADSLNILSAKSNAILFTARAGADSPAGTGDMRLNLNKAAKTNTLSVLYQTNYSGRAEAGLCGDDQYHIKVSPDGNTWFQALVIDPATGIVSFPSGTSGNGSGGGAQFAANRNRLINPSFAINQRGYTSGKALSAGAYAHDRWKAGASGCSYTFTQNAVDTLIAITAGSLQQVVENVNIVDTGYTLSWTGTAQGRMGINGAAPSGAYAPSPLTVGGALPGQSISVEFTAGTLGKVQLEGGASVSAFERRLYGLELFLCQRYFYAFNTANVQGISFNAAAGGAYVALDYAFPVPMRATPSVGGTITFASSANISGAPQYGSIYQGGFFLGIHSASAGNTWANYAGTLMFSAEL